MKVLAAMSGGVDSSVAAARLLEAGHEVVGVTMKLWGGESDTGCCSVSDVDDARRVAQQLGIVHHVWTFTDDFDRHVVEPYVEAHRVGLTPNPCVECNRHLKFDRLLERALAVGFDAVATGHHARLVERPDGSRRLARGADRAKDQSYVLYVLGQRQLARTLLPVGDLTKVQVRAEADRLGLRTASKPDSQDVCFITSTAGRSGFLSRRLALHPAPVVDDAGAELATVDAVELVTIGQRRGLGLPGGGAPRYVVDVDVPGRRVRVGSAADLAVDTVALTAMVWADDDGDRGDHYDLGRPAGRVGVDDRLDTGPARTDDGLDTGPGRTGDLGRPAGRVGAGEWDAAGRPLGPAGNRLGAGPGRADGDRLDAGSGRMDSSAGPAGNRLDAGSGGIGGSGGTGGGRRGWSEVAVLAQCSAHGAPRPGRLVPDPDDPARAEVRFDRPQRRVAPGQSVVLYQGDEVVAGGLAAADDPVTEFTD